jgi:hypothetical protein
MTSIPTEAELAESLPTKILVMHEVDGHAVKLMHNAVSVWTVWLKNGTRHFLAIRANGEHGCVADDCADKPICPALARFLIDGARKRVGEHTQTINGELR